MTPGFLRREWRSALLRGFHLAASLALFASLTPVARAAFSVTPTNGPVTSLPPQFSIVASWDNPQPNGTSYTDHFWRVGINYTSSSWSTSWNIGIGAANYNGNWSYPWWDPPKGNQTFAFTAYYLHYSPYSVWVDGYEEEDGHWEWDENAGQDVYVVDGSHWVDGHWEYGVTSEAVAFGSATHSFISFLSVSYQ